MNEADASTLLLLPALRASRGSDGAFRLTRKFIDGAAEMASRWPGLTKVMIEVAPEADMNLDPVDAHPSALPFEVAELPADDATMLRLLRGVGVALASIVDKHVRMGRLCAEAGVPLIVYTEYTLKTRLQVARVTSPNPIVRMRRQWWEQRLERGIVSAIRSASGLQCNGTPTFDAYRSINPRPLLYFDTRIREEMLADRNALQARIDEMRAGRPLRLAFSGRLARMKGADHLPLVAAELKRRGVRFHMDICGGGELEKSLQSQIRDHALQDCVHLRGVLDFERELVPFITRNVDLFVCCHRQGDPSCTYLETLSCGTPIAGYANEAFEGLVRRSGVGWLAPMDEHVALAAIIAELDGQREALAKAAFDSLDFASGHTFERTIDARMNHVRAVADEWASTRLTPQAATAGGPTR